jgi:hypothetical protein
MNTIEFSKRKGETLDVSTLLKWVERHINWLGNGLYELKIAKKVKRRSMPQNRLMWMWFACIGQDTGQSVESIHDYYAYKFLPRYITELETGAQVRVPGHTSTLTTEAFTEFLNQVQADAASELNITLPTPDDLAWEEFEAQYKEYAR